LTTEGDGKESKSSRKIKKQGREGKSIPEPSDRERGKKRRKITHQLVEKKREKGWYCGDDYRYV